ncbi:PAK-box/P21-Rho-binding domain-containing protein [Paramicrosporidium saccamoebae]|uniref:PAK-box/P21-Rho-binding domain-containing protein n=1 Tax=Paramicrosporidium saccamoebae TaxID=1246581 RepID=A0A2H9TJG7_9FUNG|nr:PAK-box/P21-Rho-binding domain-containing protein [Paramicrosporidium saccamoebae]
MSNASRPTWSAATGSATATTAQYSSRDLTAHAKLKLRQTGQGAPEEMRKRDLRAELLGEKQSVVNVEDDKDIELLQASVSEPEAGSNSDSDSDSEEEEEEEEEDDTEALLLELEKIKKEREAERLRQDSAKLERSIHGNPLLDPDRNSFTIVAATVAKLYLTSMRPDRWTPQGHEGALVLLKDRTLGGLFFRLVHLDNARIVWEHEVCFDFEYRLDCDFFHSFESDDGRQIGLLFADEKEAADFAQVVYQKSEILQLSSRRSGDNSPSREGSIKSVTDKESGGFFGLFRSKKDKRRSSELTANDIGDPTEFRHLAHIGFNASTGAFDVQNIPAEWKAIFQKAGVTTEQLENKDTAGFIADFVKQMDGPGKSSSQQSFKTRNKGPPPPPPAKSIKGPAPPPPTRSRPETRQESPMLNTQREVPMPEEGLLNPKPTPQAVPMDAGRANLLASIRNTDKQQLRAVERSNSTNSLNTPSVASDDQSDIMASMLAKALAERNRKLAHSDSDNDDSEW